MSYYPPTYPYRIYQKFKELDSGDYHTIVQFYEENEEAIRQLEVRAFFELLVAYANALFETGAYQKHLDASGLAIRLSIIHNIKYHAGNDIYLVLLFQKAASNYNLMHYDAAIHILRELIKIDPNEGLYKTFLKKCLRKKHPRYLKNTRAFSILLFLLAAIIICVEVLMIRTMYRFFLPTVLFFRNILFLSGILLLVGGEIIHFLSIRVEVREFVKEVKDRKK